MADVSFTCRGYNYGLIGELEYELNRKIGPVEFLVINLPSDPNPVAHFIRVDTTSARTATLTWDGGSPVAGTYLMSLYVVNREGTMSGAMTLEVIVDRTAPVVFISRLLGASVTPAPINRIHTPTASLTDTAVATVNSIYEGDVKPHTFSLINSYKSSRKYTIDSSTGEIFYDTTKDVISLLTVDRDDITVDSDEISCDATLLETSGGGTALSALNTAKFNGSTQRFDAGNPVPLQISGNISVSFRVKWDLAPSGTEIMFSKFRSGGNQRSFQIAYIDGSNTIRCDISTDGGGGSVVSASAAAPAGGVWTTVLMVHDGVDLKLYLNGVEEDSVTLGTAVFDSTASVFIGNRDEVSPDLPSDASIAFPKIWNTDLSAAEAVELHNGGDPKCFQDLSTGLKTGLVYAPDLGNTGATGSELIDKSPSGITTTDVGSTPFTGSGLDVECSTGGDPLDGTVHEVGYQVTDSRDTYSGTAKFVYKDTTFIGGIV